MTNLRVRPITPAEHLAFIAARPSASHMQVPSWGAVKPDWRAESLGWFEEASGQPVGVGLVLYRPVPKLKKYLAYLPEVRSSTGTPPISTAGSTRCSRTSSRRARSR